MPPCPQLLLPGPTPRVPSLTKTSKLEREVQELTNTLNETKAKYDAVLNALADLVSGGHDMDNNFLQVYKEQLNPNYTPPPK